MDRSHPTPHNLDFATEPGKDDVGNMIQLYALVGKMRLWASRPVVTAAEHAMRSIVETYLEPNRSLQDIRVLAIERRLNVLQDFGEACRAELAGPIHGRVLASRI